VPLDEIDQRANVIVGEAAAEVARGRGIGNAAGSEGVEERLVLATEFQVLEASAITEGVVGDG
jgi:hypothetical protein